MAEVEKMVALKKAYADIILNTAKEAAARVMASERKAFRFQQDLCYAKDEGVRMLLRLKRMLDSKITEAEITATSQRRRIEELEAQLHEAEGIIVDLRIELKLVQDELVMVKNNQVQPSNVQIANEEPRHENRMPENKLHTFEHIALTCSDSGHANLTSDLNTFTHQNRLNNQCCDAIEQAVPSSDSHLENFHADNPDLASITMRAKELEMYKNGCTQRIRAFEGNLLDGKLPPGDVDDQPKKHKSIVTADKKGEGEKGEEMLTAPSPRIKNEDLIKNPVGLEEVMQLNSRICGDQSVKVIRRLRRRRKTRFGNAKSRSRKSCPRQLIKPSQLSSALSHYKACTNSINDNTISGGPSNVPSSKADNMGIKTNSVRLEEKLQSNGSCYEDQVVQNARIGHGKRKVKCSDMFATSSRSPPHQLAKSGQPSFLSRCKTCLLNGNAKSGGDMLEINDSEAKMKPLSRLDSAASTHRVVQNAAEGKVLVDESVLVKQENETSKSLKIPSCKMDLEMVALPLMDAELLGTKASEANNEAPSQADNDRLLKYTFQRKRKKDSLSNPDENASAENSTAKRRLGDEQNGASEPQKSSLINESTRDSRRLAQVARQLISLSGKRWW